MNPTVKKISGLYALTPDWQDTARLTTAVREALAGGVRVVQYRSKQADSYLKQQQALQLLALCREFAALLIINDDVELALAIGADGVHLGAEDAPLTDARTRLGHTRLIGVSCYNSLARALEAEEQGADYVAFGSFFASPTKPQAIAAPLALLSEAKSALRLPVVAIGGITLDNAASVIEAGADAIAVISNLFDSTNVRNTAQAFGQLFEHHSNPNQTAIAS